MSIALRKSYFTIAVCEISGKIIVDQDTANPRARTMAKSLLAAADKAALAFPPKLKARDLKVIDNALNEFLNSIWGRPIPVSAITSLALGVLEEPLSAIREPRKIAALKRVALYLQNIHDFYSMAEDDLAGNEMAGSILDKFKFEW